MENESLIFNRKLPPTKVEKVEADGQEFYKVPVSILRNGFYNGFLYGAEVLQKESVVNSWNDINVILDHQEDEKNTLYDVANKSLGRLYDMKSKFENGVVKLVGNAYFKADKVSEGMLDQIKNGMNISTCMWGRVKQGTKEIVDMIPRHLALLPDKPAGFPQSDGIGTMYNNQNYNNKTGEKKMPKETTETAEEIYNSAKELVKKDNRISEMETEIKELKNELEKAKESNKEEIENKAKELAEEKIENEKRAELYKKHEISEELQKVYNKLSVSEIEEIEKNKPAKKEDKSGGSDYSIANADVGGGGKQNEEKPYINPTYKTVGKE